MDDQNPPATRCSHLKRNTKNAIETAGKYELNSTYLETEIDQKWKPANYQGWALGMVRVNDKTGKVTGSPREIPMSNKTECKAALLKSMYVDNNHGMSDIAFFCFDSMQK